MKTMALFLSLVIALLSANPCADGRVSTPSKVVIAEQHANHQHNNDLCSPFCSCACCGAQLLNYTPQPVFQVAGAVISPSQNVSGYKNRFSASYYVRIWQPPQIS